MTTEVALPQLTQSQKVMTLAGTLLAMFLAALDQTIVATAGPDIQKSLSMEPALYTWITTAYLVSSTVLVPIYGKLSDLYGRKNIILVGIVIFLAGSVACGLAQTPGQLICFRALQGVGSASLFTSAFAIVADLFPPSERGRYSGLFGAVFGISSLVGPLLGGFITDHFGWHWVFFINMPIGALALTFIITRMPPLKREHVKPPTVDVFGAVLLAVGVIPFLLAASFGRIELRPHDNGFLWGSWQVLSMFGLSLAGTVAFIAWELRTPEPLVDLRLFKNQMMAWGSATVFVLGAAFLTPMVFLPLFMVNVVGVTNTASGLTISPLVMGIVAGNILSGQLVSRFGKYKPLMLVALLVLMTGFAIMGFTLHADSTQAEVTLKMIVVGLGLGPSIPLYTLAIQNAVPPQQIGVATSMSTFFRQMGSTFGIAVVGSLFASTLSGELKSRMTEATKGLPPQLVQRFAQGGGAPDEGGPMQRFDATKVKAQVGAQLDAAKEVAVKALNGEALAMTLVASSPLADDRLKAAIANGGVREQVKKSFDAMGARVEAAAASPEEWVKLQEATDLPPPIKLRLQQVPPAAIADPVGRTEIVEGLKKALAAAAHDAQTHAVQQAITAVQAGIEANRPKAFAAVDAVDLALKESFTLAVRRVYLVALVLAALAFLLTLRLPQLALRKSVGAAPAPAAE